MNLILGSVLHAMDQGCNPGFYIRVLCLEFSWVPGFPLFYLVCFSSSFPSSCEHVDTGTRHPPWQAGKMLSKRSQNPWAGVGARALFPSYTTQGCRLRLPVPPALRQLAAAILVATLVHILKTPVCSSAYPGPVPTASHLGCRRTRVPLLHFSLRSMDSPHLRPPVSPPCTLVPTGLVHVLYFRLNSKYPFSPGSAPWYFQSEGTFASPEPLWLSAFSFSDFYLYLVICTFSLSPCREGWHFVQLGVKIRQK